MFINKTIDELNVLIDGPMHDDVRTHLQNYRDLLFVMHTAEADTFDSAQDIATDVTTKMAAEDGIDLHAVSEGRSAYTMSDVVAMYAGHVAAAIREAGEG